MQVALLKDPPWIFADNVNVPVGEVAVPALVSVTVALTVTDPLEAIWEGVTVTEVDVVLLTMVSERTLLLAR